MADSPRDEVAELNLQTVIGTRLREQRVDRGTSLRDAAAAAAISPAHLSDIENGNSHASLPVLVRLCRALHLPLAELLPRLGGRRIRETAATSDRPGLQRLSHPELELRVDRLVLPAGGERVDQIAADDDVFVFVVAGACTVIVDGVGYELGPRDSADIERATALHVTSADGVTLLITRASRR